MTSGQRAPVARSEQVKDYRDHASVRYRTRPSERNHGSSAFSPPTRTRNRAGERLDYVALTEGEIYYQANPPVKQNSGFQGLVEKEGFRKPCSTTLRFHDWTGGNRDGRPTIRRRRVASGRASSYKTEWLQAPTPVSPPRRGWGRPQAGS